MAYRPTATASVYGKRLKYDTHWYWRRQQTIRQGIVIVVIVAIVTVLFVGAIRVLAPGNSAP